MVLNRWSADRCRSALFFQPVRNNLFQFHTLKRRYQFRSSHINSEVVIQFYTLKRRYNCRQRGEWLKHRTHDQHGIGLKPNRAILL